MATRRLFDGATIEIGQVPIVGAGVPPIAGTIFWFNVSGVWKQVIVWFNVSGVWKQTTPFVNIGGVWK
jgi:hypothetical protein